MQMRSSLRVFSALVLIAVLVSGCSSAARVWIPPSAPPGALLAVVDLLPVVAPQQAVAVVESPTPPSLPIEPPTATPQPAQDLAVEDAPVEDPAALLTPFSPPDPDAPILYYAQAADSLPVVAVRFGVDPSEITSPDPLPESAFIDPGQLLVIPKRLEATTLSEKLLPDSEVVFSPSAADFDVAVYLAKAGGKLRSYQEWLKSTGLISGAQAIARIAAEDSINPRLLLSLLEYQSGWVTGQPATQDAEDYPMGFVDPSYKGLTRQMVWAVNQLSIGYYAYREGRLTEIEFKDGSTARLAPDLNAGTAALQYFFAQLYDRPGWEAALDVDNGFPALHRQMFGDPWERANAVEPLFPRNLKQPALSLPFVRNWEWSYTGGPHGAWEQDGAYAALDFAPGSDQSGCVDSSTWATASASGLVVRSGKGVVVLDLDGDGREQTGWVLVYLHVSTDGRLPVGTWVDQDDPLGRPSCEGGISTGTHVHIARKYNGEWIPADGPLAFDLGGWVAHAGEQAYKGTLTRGDQTLKACTCSSPETFITRGPNDP
jgi:LasA protease